MEANGVIVGGHPWVYAAKQPGYDVTPILPQVFADMSSARLDGIELMSNVLLPDDSVERIRALSREHDLPVIGTSFGGAMWDPGQHAAIMSEAETVIPRLAELGGTTFGVSVGAVKGRKTPEQLDAQSALLERLITLCERHGVTLNLHNHTYEVVDGMHDLRGTLARVPGVKLGPDFDWLRRGGVDPVEFIQEFGERIVFAHLRDEEANGRWVEAMGEGAMDYAAIGQALRAAGFHGPLVIELAHESDFTPTRPLAESFRLSREYVRRTMGR